MPSLRPSVLAAREKLAEGRARLKEQHDAGSPSVQVCTRLTDLLDTVLLDIYESALEELGGDVVSNIALVPHGGFGRRDIAPFSDVDLMLLHAPGKLNAATPLARRLTQDIVDAGLQLGFSLRTPGQACALAMQDATIFTTLAEARYLGGSVQLYSSFATRFRRQTRRKTDGLITTIEQARREERQQFGETVYLLKPNVKRSRGALRDIQLLRWIGFARYGEVDLKNLQRAGYLAADEHKRLRRAHHFLLRVRNELHFHSGKSEDLLDRHEQVRLAELYGYDGDEGLLPVEKFMRDYFQHTSDVRNIVSNFVASARSPSVVSRLVQPLLSHQFEGDFRVGPKTIGANRRGMEKVQGDLAQVLRLMDLSNLYNKRIDHRTWETIRLAMSDRDSIELTPEAASRFMSILSQPPRLTKLLRRLHELRVLEKIIPAMKHARCLLQFNEYHKYTVDEHSFRAVQHATDLLHEDSSLGRAYRDIRQKDILHLAILLHDCGKGFPEDHSDVGRDLAAETADLLGLSARDKEILMLLVHKHLLMSHLAQRRDISDDQVITEFARVVGSPDVLKMLYVLTCCDLAAVGPGVLNDWKQDLITQLYRRTRRQIADDSPWGGEDALRRRLQAIREQIPEFDGWWERQLTAMPNTHLFGNDAREIVSELQRLRALGSRDAVAWGRYLAERRAVEYTVGATENIASGIFHRLTGVLSSKGQQILSAEIITLADGLVLDRFYVTDLDFAAAPPAGRIDEVCEALQKSLTVPEEKPPTFRRTWQPDSGDDVTVNRQPTEIKFDNSTSERHTILDIFTRDRIGLLYAISKTIFDCGLSVQLAKIGTYIDQVVDVFYVTDRSGRKVTDEATQEKIRAQLMERIEVAGKLADGDVKSWAR